MCAWIAAAGRTCRRSLIADIRSPLNVSLWLSLEFLPKPGIQSLINSHPLENFIPHPCCMVHGRDVRPVCGTGTDRWCTVRVNLLSALISAEAETRMSFFPSSCSKRCAGDRTLSLLSLRSFFPRASRLRAHLMRSDEVHPILPMNVLQET